MDSLALRPRKPTEIIDAAVEVYRRNPIHFLLLAAIVRVPWLVLQILLLSPSDSQFTAASKSLLVSAGTMISYFLMAGFVVHMASEVYLGRKTDAFTTMRSVWQSVPSVFAASLLQSLALGLGLLLLFFPAIWVSAVIFAVVPVIVLENAGPFKGFARSYRLSDGFKWHILSTLGLVVLIRIVLEIGIVIIGVLISNPELQVTFVAAAGMLIYPLLGIAQTLLYYDIRIRKEGFDIEMMAQMADRPASVETPA